MQPSAEVRLLDDGYLASCKYAVAGLNVCHTAFGQNPFTGHVKAGCQMKCERFKDHAIIEDEE
jgi:hypothetical protein